MGNPNIGNEAKKAWTTFKEWQSWNPNWRPKKGIALVNAQLAEEWVLPATKADIEANYMAMLQLWQDKLTDMANDKWQPMLIRIIAKNMLWGKWFDIVEKMLDRWIGKAVQKNETELSWTITTKADISDMTDEEVQEYIKNKLKGGE